MLYDILPLLPPQTSELVEVNSTTFNVDCGSLPNARQVGSSLNDSVAVGTLSDLVSIGPVYTFDLGAGLDGVDYLTAINPLGTYLLPG